MGKHKETGGSTVSNGHDKHVSDGYCPVISKHKEWCGKTAGHPGKHGSPRIPTPGIEIGPLNPKWLEWTD